MTCRSRDRSKPQARSALSLLFNHANFTSMEIKIRSLHLTRIRATTKPLSNQRAQATCNLHQPDDRHESHRLNHTQMWITIAAASFLFSLAPTRAQSQSNRQSKENASERNEQTHKPRSFVLPVNRLPSRQQIRLGQIPSHQKISICITVKNCTAQTLRISRIKTDCGCMSTEVSSSEAAPHGILRWTMQLTEISRTGLMNRRLRVIFDQTTDLHLDLNLTGEVIGPLTLQDTRVYHDGENKTITLKGSKDCESRILKCQALLGSARIKGFTEHLNTFELQVEPLIRFGRAKETLRFYLRQDEEDLTADIPFEIDSRRQAIFLPSSTMVSWIDGEASIRAKLVVSPQGNTDPRNHQITLGHEGNPQSGMMVSEIRWKRISPVLFELQASLRRKDKVTPPQIHHKEKPLLLSMIDSDQKTVATLQIQPSSLPSVSKEQ